MSERLKKGYLQWRCRRGTKELDVVLNRFLDSSYDQLTDTELVDFDELLNAQDTHLWYWLSGKEKPEDLKTQEVVAKVVDSKTQ